MDSIYSSIQKLTLEPYSDKVLWQNRLFCTFEETFKLSVLVMILKYLNESRSTDSITKVGTTGQHYVRNIHIEPDRRIFGVNVVVINKPGPQPCLRGNKWKQRIGNTLYALWCRFCVRSQAMMWPPFGGWRFLLSTESFVWIKISTIWNVLTTNTLLINLPLKSYKAAA